MNEPPGARARVALSALTVAEYFRDEEGQDVLLFVDNIFRFTQAGSEVSALLGRIPSAVGYQPTLVDRDGRAPGAHHLDQQGLDHLGAGHLRARRRPHRPGAGHGVRPPRRHHRALARHLRARHLPGRRSARLDLDACSIPQIVGERPLRRRARASSGSCRGTRTCRTSSPSSAWTSSREDDKLIVVARPQDPALPLAAVLRRRAVHRPRRQVRAAQGDDRRLRGDPRRQARRPARSRRSTCVGNIDEVKAKAAEAEEGC